MRIFAKVVQKALITRTGGDHLYSRHLESQVEYVAILRGKHRLADRPYTLPIAVGDIVLGYVEEAQFVLMDWEPRKNWLIRQDPHNPYRQQILGANLDQAFLLVTVESPFTPQRYIDGFLVLCEAYGVPVSLLFTKADVPLRAKVQARKTHLMTLYRDLGYWVQEVSPVSGLGLDTLRAKLTGQTSFLTGLSGVGKTTLINALIPGLGLRTQPLAKLTQKGRHTTTYTALYDLPGGGALIDSPGFGEFTPAGIARAELSHYFPEMRARLKDCRFANCLHIDEPDCAVQRAVAAGAIAHSRYHTYLALLEKLESASEP